MDGYRRRRGQTLSMQWVAFLLQSVNLDLIQGGQLTEEILRNSKTHSGSRDCSALGIGCTYTVNFILPLAIELGLKALILYEGKTPVKKHDLLDLHKQLSSNTQNLLAVEFKRLYEGKNIRLVDLLEAHKSDFENWRYLDEPDLVRQDEIGLQYAVCAILNVDDKLVRKL